MRQADISGDPGMIRAQASAAIAAFTMFVLSAAASESAGNEDAAEPGRCEPS